MRASVHAFMSSALSILLDACAGVKKNCASVRTSNEYTGTGHNFAAPPVAVLVNSSVSFHDSFTTLASSGGGGTAARPLPERGAPVIE